MDNLIQVILIASRLLFNDPNMMIHSLVGSACLLYDKFGSWLKHELGEIERGTWLKHEK